MSNILHRADQIVNHRSEEKERQYGPFAECMSRATAIYNAMSPKEEQISSLGLYRALIALKLSREAYAHKEDNLLDACAYMGAMNHVLENSWPDFKDDDLPIDDSTDVICVEWWTAKDKKQEYFDNWLDKAHTALEKGLATQFFALLYPGAEPVLAFETYIDHGESDPEKITWYNKELLDSLGIKYM